VCPCASAARDGAQEYYANSTTYINLRLSIYDFGSRDGAAARRVVSALDGGTPAISGAPNKNDNNVEMQNQGKLGQTDDSSNSNRIQHKGNDIRTADGDFRILARHRVRMV
jgi:hypothetical protein